MSCLPFSFQNNILLIIWEFHICTPVIVIAQSTRSTVHFCDSFTPAKKAKDKGKKYIESSLYCSYTHCKRSFLWPLQSAPAQIMDFHMLSGDSKDHKHPHGLQWEHGPHTSTQSLTTAGPQTPTWPPLAAWSTDINIASSCNTDHRCLIWPPMIAQSMEINMASGGSMDYRH